MSKKEQINNFKGMWQRMTKYVAEHAGGGRAGEVTYDPDVDTEEGSVGEALNTLDEKVDVSNDTQLRVKIGADTYVLNGMEKLVKPNAPTLTEGGTFNKSKNASITNVASGGTAKYTINGAATQTGTSITLNQDSDKKQVSYTIVAWVEKNGLASDTTTEEYKINRQVEIPSISFDGNKYSTSRTITLSCNTANVTLEYKIGDGNWTTYDSSSKPTVANSEKVYARASKTDWVSAENSADVTIGSPKCYIGQAANVTTEEQIKALTYDYEQDTLVGSTKSIDFGDSTEYVWFAVPSGVTIAKVSSDGFAVPVGSATTIGSYKVYRTNNKINSSFNFKFE